jgi:hypothetical protein
MVLPARVYDKVRELSKRTGVPANRITTLALDFWLTTYYAGYRLARAFADPAIAYDESGAARSLEEVAQIAKENQVRG